MSVQYRGDQWSVCCRSTSGSPGRRRRRSSSLGSPCSARASTCRAELTPKPSSPAARPDHWLRMSMRRVRPFRLEPPARPTSAPVVTPVSPPSQPVRPHSGPARPSRGQRRRISSSTGRRRVTAASALVSPDHAWTRHPLSDDEEDSAPSLSITSTPEHHHHNLHHHHHIRQESNFRYVLYTYPYFSGTFKGRRPCPYC